MSVWLSIVHRWSLDMHYYSIGLGCDRGTSLLTVQRALQQALQKIGAHEMQIRHIATIDLKADEVAFIALAQQLNLVLECYSATQLASVPVANPSMTVLKFVGTPSVSEAAALLAAGYVPEQTNQNRTQIGSITDLKIGSMTDPTLVLEKFKHSGDCGKNVTISIAEIPS